MIEQTQDVAEADDVRKIEPIWKAVDSLAGMFHSRLMT